jgi:hypothetical protein
MPPTTTTREVSEAVSVQSEVDLFEFVDEIVIPYLDELIDDDSVMFEMESFHSLRQTYLGWTIEFEEGDDVSTDNYEQLDNVPSFQTNEEELKYDTKENGEHFDIEPCSLPLRFAAEELNSSNISAEDKFSKSV